MTENDTREVTQDVAAPNVSGYLATAAVVVPCLLIMGAWQAGPWGDVLLTTAALGLIFRIPHTVAIWAGLTLLVATALALVINSQAAAESFANYAYYGLAVGCLWAIWNVAAERFRWNMPATRLHGYLVRHDAYRSVAVPLLAVTVVIIAMGTVISGVAGSVGDLLAGLVLFSVLRRPRPTFVLCAGATLAVVAGVLFIVGLRAAATTTGLLGGGAFLAALIQLGWHAVRQRLRRPGTAAVTPATAVDEDAAGAPIASAGRARVSADG